MAITVFQLVGVILTVTLCFMVARQRRSRLQHILQWNSVCVAVCMLSYFFEMTAANKEAAFLAVIFENLSLAGIVSMIVMFVIEYCNANVPKWLTGVLFGNLAAVEVLIMTNDLHHLHYVSYDLIQQEGFKQFVSVPGVSYYWYAVSIIACIILCVAVTINAAAHASNKKKKRSYIFVMLTNAPALMFFPIKLLDLFNGFDIGPILMMIMTVCFFILTKQYRIFDLAAVAKENVLQAISESVIVLDADGEIVYNNKTATETFPQLLGDDANEFVSAMLRNEQNEFVHEGRFYEWKTSRIDDNDRFEGIAICITDVTYLKKHNQRLEGTVNEQTRTIAVQSRKLADTRQQIIISMAELIDRRGQQNVDGERVRRTTSIVSLLARTLQARGFFPETLTDEYVDNLCKAAPLYDIGKIAVPDVILQKPGRFTEEEYRVMQTHAHSGGKIIRNLLRKIEDPKFIDMAYDIATYHHEKYNGSGYPTGISGDKIPLSARIMAVADVFDELVSERSYKAAVPVSKAISMIESGKGKHFDPVVTEVFVSLRSRIENLIKD